MKKFTYKLNNKISNNKGFTLIEVLIVIALLAIVSALVNTSVMGMERHQSTTETQTDVNILYNKVQDVLVDLRDDGTLNDKVTIPSGELWRGFNPGVGGGFDVAYMVDYPDYLYEGNTPIDYSTTGLNVDQGYQIPELTGLIPPEAGVIQAYGILFELHTGTLLEVTLIQVPYEESGDVNYNASMATKFAVNAIGTGIRDPYENASAGAYTFTNPDTGVTTGCVPSSGALLIAPPNGYGVSHVFNRDNMMSSINANELYSRYRYCVLTVDNLVFHGSPLNTDSYLEHFNEDIHSVLSYASLKI